MYADIKANMRKINQLTDKALNATDMQEIEDVLDALVESSREIYNMCLLSLGANDDTTKDAFSLLKRTIIITDLVSERRTQWTLKKNS
jgi:hypothetical protein